jgi:hypothetical protein
MVQPPNPEAKYHGRPIPPEYAVVEVMWTHDHHDDDELDFANEVGDTTLGRALGTRVLWNKADIILDMPKPASKSSQPSSSPPGGPSDDDDDASDDGNNNDGGPSSTPPRSPCPNPSNRQGDTRGAPGHQTPPPSKGKGKCPPALKKPAEEEGDRPAHLTTEEWVAFNIAEEHKYTTVFKRYIC